jgi:cytochrome c
MNARMLSAFVVVLTAVAVGSAGRATGNQPPTEEVKALAEQSGCLKCHAADKKIVGPAFHDIAARYKDDSRARATLREKVKKGGKGNWTEVTGGVVMPPHSGLLPDALIAQLVDWVLSH